MASRPAASVKLLVTPSFLPNNLAASPDGLAFAHLDEVAVFRASAWDARGDAAGAPLERLPPSRAGVAVTSLAWAPAPGAQAPLLAVTTHEELLVYKAPAAGAAFVQQPALSAALADLPAALLGARAPAAHFFRGLAPLPAAALLLVGTSWGDVLAWSTRATPGVAAPPVDGLALRGAHACAISAIAADERCVRARLHARVPRKHAAGLARIRPLALTTRASHTHALAATL